MKYIFNEGAFEIPASAQDRTVNVLILSDAPAGLSLVVNRDQFEPGEDFEGFIKRQLHTISRQVKQFQEHARRGVKIGSSQLAGMQLDTSFKQNGQAFHQQQTVFQIPNGKVLVATLTSAIPLTQEHRALSQRMLDSFVPAA
ncbi:DcrB-related protein [Cystobacter fuscus]